MHEALLINQTASGGGVFRGAVAMGTDVKTNFSAQNVTNCTWFFTCRTGNPFIPLLNTDILLSDHFLVLIDVTPWSG